MRDGLIQLKDDLFLRPSLTEGEFLAQATDAERGLYDGPHQAYLTSPFTRRGRTYRPALFFSNGQIVSAELLWVDPAPGNAVLCSDRSIALECDISSDDAAWLAAELGEIDPLVQNYDFSWGSVSAGSNERRGLAVITIIFSR